MTVPGRPVTLRDVLRIRAFAVLYIAETQSIAGDQLARIALAVLVFERTGSVPATAATYAFTFAPAVFGGMTVGKLGDRFPRRTVMTCTELARAAAFAGAALPWTPTVVTLALVVLAVFVGPAFSAAQLSYLSTELDAAEFQVANAMRLISSQAAQVVGFAVGGAVVATVGPRWALAIDAATFVVSGALVAVIGRPRRGGGAPRPQAVAADDTSPRETSALLWRDRTLRGLVGMALLIGFFVVPEGLAVPVGAEISASTAQIGLLLASGALGGAVGALAFVRLVPESRRGAWARGMAIGCGIPLVVSAMSGDVALTCVLWFVSGGLAAYIVQMSTVLVQAIPDRVRSHLVGVVGSAVLAAQGLGVLAFGWIGDVVGARAAVGLAGGIGTLAAIVLVAGPLRSVTGAPPTVATASDETARS